MRDRHRQRLPAPRLMPGPAHPMLRQWPRTNQKTTPAAAKPLSRSKTASPASTASARRSRPRSPASPHRLQPLHRRRLRHRAPRQRPLPPARASQRTSPARKSQCPPLKSQPLKSRRLPPWKSPRPLLKSQRPRSKNRRLRSKSQRLPLKSQRLRPPPHRPVRSPQQIFLRYPVVACGGRCMRSPLHAPVDTGRSVAAQTCDAAWMTRTAPPSRAAERSIAIVPLRAKIQLACGQTNLPNVVCRLLRSAGGDTALRRLCAAALPLCEVRRTTPCVPSCWVWP